MTHGPLRHQGEISHRIPLTQEFSRLAFRGGFLANNLAFTYSL